MYQSIHHTTVALKDLQKPYKPFNIQNHLNEVKSEVGSSFPLNHSI